MRRLNEQNERLKRDYLGYLKDAEGYDEATRDKVAASLLMFEEALGFKAFKVFHRDWAATFKSHLEARKSQRTGKPLGLSTRDGILRDVKGFFHWLASQPGFKSRLTYHDVRYFNNNAKDARAAHAQRPKRYPSLAQCAHAFRLMPQETVVDRRNRAMFALWVMTGARAGALASLRVQHVDLIEGVVYQDGREVRTKGAKSFETWFFPVDAVYREAFEAWFTELTERHLFGPGDALFPKQKVGTWGGSFAAIGLDPEPYANAQKVREVIGGAFSAAGLHPFNPHSIRTTLAMLGDKLCPNMEARKAWSQNLGHESLATTVSAYTPVGRERQGELIKGLGRCP
ncbi:MAG: site-specific integrase [Pseudomonadota bacterium]